ncbi:MAG: hypothetical protein ACF8PN_07865 [Phycisphaerales bacterium]
MQAALLTAACAGTAAAAPPGLTPVAGDPAVPVAPIAIAPVDASGAVGEWRPYVAGDFGACNEAIYDAFEGIRNSDPCGFGFGAPTDGSQAGGFDPYCDPAGTGDPCAGAGVRWWFGATYVQGGRRTSGMVTQNNSGTVCRLQVQWSNALNSGQFDPLGREIGDTVIVINVYDDAFDMESCGEENFAGFLSGVALDFGPLNAGSYFANVDLSGSNVHMSTPIDGPFGHEVQFFYDSSLSTVGANNQVFLWGPKDPAEQGEAFPVVYDDDNSDGIFDISECAAYIFGLCPEPLTNAVAFYAADRPQLSISGGCPGTIRLRVENVPEGNRVGYIYSFTSESFVKKSGVCSGVAFGLGAEPGVIGWKEAGEDNTAVIRVRGPRQACGQLYVQALDLETCLPTNVVRIPDEQ